MPLVYFHGYTNPKDNIELYKTLISNVAGKIDDRLARDEDARSSGIVVNTTGWIDGDGFTLLLHAIQALTIDVVLVMGQDKLYSNLVTALDGAAKSTTVVKLPRSGGVVSRVSVHFTLTAVLFKVIFVTCMHYINRADINTFHVWYCDVFVAQQDQNTRKRLRKSLIREYFYGRASALPQALSTTVFSPERREAVPLSSFNFLRVGGIQLSEGMKVFGQSSHQDAFKLSKIVPSQELAYSVVAVLHPQDWDSGNRESGKGAAVDNKTGEVPQSLLGCNVAGFVSIVQVDVERGVMTLLCPCPGALPSNNLLVGSIKWME